MDALTLFTMLKVNPSTETAFDTVLAADQLCRVKPDKFYIINTAKADKSGQHWIAVFTGKTPEFFDSLGHPPDYYRQDFESLMIIHGPAYRYNTLPVQANGTSTCGQFCLYYIYQRCAGLAFQDIINHFSRDLNSNEAFIRGIV